MDKSTLSEHVKQINDAVSAFIETQGMIAENKIREMNGYSLAYNEEAFEDVLRKYELGYNNNIDKIRRFT